MSSKLFSAATVGVESALVEVEVDVLAAGLHHFSIVGLPDTAIKESRDRVSSAIKNSGFLPPHRSGRITVNLAPADLPKASPIYDLPIALGVLCATEQLTLPSTQMLFIGELALDGTVRPVTGVLPIALFAKAQGMERLYVPADNATEAAIVTGIDVIPVTTLQSLVEDLERAQPQRIQPMTKVSDLCVQAQNPYDMVDVKGQVHAKRTLEIAAAGGHNVLFNGPPGSGKTLLAKTFPSILPRLSTAESLAVTKLYSIAGLLSKQDALVTLRPFRAPHHSASAVSLIGGGSVPRPGEISLAHHGVLFLDEFAEFPRAVLENLRQPLEDGIVTISRVRGTLVFPAEFILIAAMNPCPCGHATDAEKVCVCMPSQIAKYQHKISGPIMDRIDLHVEVPRMDIQTLAAETPGEPSATIRSRAEAARRIQARRLAETGISTNAAMSAKLLDQHCPLDDAATQLLHTAASSLQLSTRAYHRIIKVARTIADLAAAPQITTDHIAEALQYRFKG